MNEKEIQNNLEEIKNPPETELIQERLQVANENRTNMNFFLSIIAFGILTWILLGMPGI
jgi:hypothetical protein